MLKKSVKAFVSTVLSTMLFTASALTVFAEENADFTLVIQKPAETHQIGLGEETTFTVPEATGNFDEFMDEIKDNDCISVNQNESGQKTYQYNAGESGFYNINGFAQTLGENVSNLEGIYSGELRVNYGISNSTSYYREQPQVAINQPNDKEITVKENSGKTTEDLQGLILDQEFSFNWSRDLQLQQGDVFKVLNVKTGMVYKVVIKENTPVHSPASTPSSSESSGSDDASSDNSDDLPVIEMTQEEAERLIQLNQNNSTVSIGTVPVTSTMEGNFTAKSVAGAAIKTPKADISKALGLKENETAKVATWDITPTSSPLAYQSLVAGAQSVSGEIGPAIQVNILKTGLYLKSDGTLDDDAYEMAGTVDMVVGIPASFYVPGARYAVSHVLPGGKYEILEDTDDDPLTVSFPVSAGRGAYALVRIF